MCTQVLYNYFLRFEKAVLKKNVKDAALMAQVGAQAREWHPDICSPDYQDLLVLLFAM
jgi:hypothetical protein